MSKKQKKCLSTPAHAENTTAQLKRKTLKALAAGGTLGVASVTVSKWSEPLINSVILPAHAQTSVAVPDSPAPISTPGASQLVIPAGVSSITVTARGGSGGNGSQSLGNVANNGGPGTTLTNAGEGGVSVCTFAVTEGETLDIFVGGMGGDAPNNAATPGGAGGISAFGFNGGSGGVADLPDTTFLGGGGGGGGGASGVQRAGTNLIVAGGGGGGGGVRVQAGSGSMAGAGGGAGTDGGGSTLGVDTAGNGGMAGGNGSSSGGDGMTDTSGAGLSTVGTNAGTGGGGGGVAGGGAGGGDASPIAPITGGGAASGGGGTGIGCTSSANGGNSGDGSVEIVYS